MLFFSYRLQPLQFLGFPLLYNFFSDKIVILPEGGSSLNRFAKRLEKASTNASEDQVAGVTQLIFDPEVLKESSATGVFRFGAEYNKGKLVGKSTNSISLSFDAIIDLKPTSTEFHELFHWKSYFKQSRVELDSLAYGHLNLAKISKDDENKNYEFNFLDEDQNYNFSFEEVPAHFIGMSKKLNEFNRTEDDEYKEELFEEILLEIISAKYYSDKMKTVVNAFFRKSVFKNFNKVNPEKIFKQFEIDKEGDALSYFHAGMFENIVLSSVHAHYPNKVGLDYEIRQEKSYWSMFLPMPKGFDDLTYFDRIRSERLKEFQLKAAQSIYYRMLFYKELIDYIDQLHRALIKEDQWIDVPPITEFYSIDRAYKAKLKELDLN